MTAIAAIKTKDGHVWMGGDRNRTIDGFSYPGQPKVWRKEDAHKNIWIFGVSGSADLQRIAQHMVELPTFAEAKDNLDTSEGLCAYVNAKYVPKLFQEVRAADELTRNSDGSANMGATILLGLRGTIFRITGFAAVAVGMKYVTCGKGADPAMAWLHALDTYASAMTPEEKIRSAITEAGVIYSSIGGGIDVVSTLPIAA